MLAVRIIGEQDTTIPLKQYLGWGEMFGCSSHIHGAEFPKKQEGLLHE